MRHLLLPVILEIVKRLEHGIRNIISCTNQSTARYAVEMAAVIAGNSQRMRNRPPLSLIASPISPLNQGEGVLDAALVFAEAGLPVVKPLETVVEEPAEAMAEKPAEEQLLFQVGCQRCFSRTRKPSEPDT